MTTKAEGIESCLVKSWQGWDGEPEFLYFYDCELLESAVKNTGLDTLEVADVSINLADMTAEVRQLTMDRQAWNTYKFKLQVTPIYESHSIQV